MNIKPSYADVLKNTKELTSLTPEMLKLIDTHNYLKSHTNDSLWEMVIKDIQECILEYFKTNTIGESDNNIVSYDFPYDFANHKYKYKHDLTDNISKIIENSYIPYRCCISGLSKIHGGQYLHMLNSIPFIDILATKMGYPNMTVSLCFSEYQHEYGDDYYIPTLQFKFNLKEGIQYEFGTNKITDFLLNKRKEQSEQSEQSEKEAKAKQYLANAPKGFNFDDVCKFITDKHLLSQEIRKERKDKELLDIYDFSIQLDLYEVYALLQLQGVFDDFLKNEKTIEYPYVYYFCGQFGTHYEFSKEESSQLCRILGLHDPNFDISSDPMGDFSGDKRDVREEKNPKFNFVYKNNRIYIVFDKAHKLDIPDKVMEKCKNFLTKNREKSQNDILHCVSKNKDKIIDRCLHILKCEKQFPSSSIEHIPLLEADDDDYIENLLVIDPGIITIDLENKVNNILGLQGFKLIAYTDSYNYNKDKEEVHEDICRYSIYMEFPSDLINLS